MADTQWPLTAAQPPEYDSRKLTAARVAEPVAGARHPAIKQSDPPDETIGGSGSGPQSFGPDGPGAQMKKSGADRQTGPITTGQD